jgi:tRNA(Ile)-lysidine synthase
MFDVASDVLAVDIAPSMQLIEEKTIAGDFPNSACYLIGVSGGRDSIALLYSLGDLEFKNLVVCHLNHQLRGRSSNADARFVEKLAANCHLEAEIGSANVRMLASKRKTSIETAGREARYGFFAQVAKRRRCRAIFLGHHADDLVETFLINLFRGTGSAGLGAMREVSTRSIDGVELTIVRPLLGVWRKEIDNYVRKHRLTFREDASNKTLNPLRNRIRHRVIPGLEKVVGRNIRAAIWRAAAIAGEEEDWMDGQLSDSSDVELSVANLRALPVALQRRAILKWLRAQKVSEIGFDVVERVRSLADHDAGPAKVNLPQDRHARRRAGRIFIE